VNSTVNDAGAFIAKDGRSLFFGSLRPGGYGGFDIWVTQRDSVDDPWGVPENLGPPINTAANEQTPTVSIDGHWLYYASDGAGGFGVQDLYRARRRDKRDDFHWGPPENLGSGVNSVNYEFGPALLASREDDALALYFSSDRPGLGTPGLGLEDIYVSVLPGGRGETFGMADMVMELSTVYREARPNIRKDGLELFLDSNRPGTVGNLDLYVSTRASMDEPWSTPENLGTTVNSIALDARPVVSFDGTELYFHSQRPGGTGSSDLYVCTRTKLRDED
jgi:Tol biopolymer transport system component